VCKDFANPLVRPHLRFYPEDLNGKICETWQAQKWLAEVGFANLSPMVAVGDIHFYVNELAECADHSYVLPFRWVVRDQVLCGDAFKVVRSEVSPHRVILISLLLICEFSDL
jgi:hypothetical protein